VTELAVGHEGTNRARHDPQLFAGWPGCSSTAAASRSGWPDGKDQPGGRPRRERCFTLEHPLPGRRTRLSFNQLAKRLSLSAPSVAARVRHLEDAHVIDGYYARVSAEAIASRSPRSCNCTAISAAALKTCTAEQFQEIEELHRLSGSSCSMVKVRIASMAHLSSLLPRTSSSKSPSSTDSSSLHDRLRPALDDAWNRAGTPAKLTDDRPGSGGWAFAR
jgi:Lrp/AsnC family transcriptional regulator, leucine-responsive regulatory protein